MRRVLALSLVLSITAAPLVLGYDDPHYKGNSVNCLSCHSIHKAAGANLTLTIANESLCMSCHNMAGSASRFPAEKLRRADLMTRWGASHAWNTPPVNASAGERVPANTRLALRTH